MDVVSAMTAIKTIAKRFDQHKNSITTEEATKTYLILPFIKDVLGYDYLDPAQVIPEYTADIPGKKGEKIDYAVFDKDGNVIMLIECKCQGASKEIGSHRDQLVRYFQCVQGVRIGVLTDGCNYEFYGDLDSDNHMDEKPFLNFNITDIKESELKKVLKFTRSEFNIEEIIGIAEELRYSGEISKYLVEVFDKGPDEDFVRFLAKKYYDKKLMTKALEKITSITKRALSQFINDRVDEMLLKAAAINKEENVKQQIETAAIGKDVGEITTTEEELLAYGIIKAIACELVPPHRIAVRDNKSYCAILFDDNNRLPVCRLHFESSNKRIRLFHTAEQPFASITSLEDIYSYRREILSTIKKCLESTKDKKEKTKQVTEEQ